MTSRISSGLVSRQTLLHFFQPFDSFMFDLTPLSPIRLTLIRQLDPKNAKKATD
jgi:hypothetical protein